MCAKQQPRAWGMKGALVAAVLVGSGVVFGQKATLQEEGGVPVAYLLERDLEFPRVVVRDGVAGPALADEGGAAGTGERLIYSNTLGMHAVNFPTNQPVSDDIATTAPNGCPLARYRFKVLGRVTQNGYCQSGSNFDQPCDSADDCPGGTCSIPSAGTPFTVTYGLYTTCPLAVGTTTAARDLVRIPGTEGVINFPDDGPRTVEHIVPAGTPVSLPTNVYLSLRFNRSNCGTSVGAPAMIGFTGDIFDFPGFPCNGYLGGFPEYPHASFWAEMFGSDQCEEAFGGYKAERPSGGIATLGANIQGVDDVQLIVHDCQMVGYEVGVKGVGFYTFELRRSCTGEPIAGTQRTYTINTGATPLLQVARFSFDPPIPLGDDNLFLAFKVSSSAAGAIVTGIEPVVGHSGIDYFVVNNDACSPVFSTQGVHGAINLAITCAGKLPTGACCDPYLTECKGGTEAGKRCLSNADCAAPGTCEAVCRETTKLNCPFPPRGVELRPEWQEREACEPDPFGYDKCGVAACCHFRIDPYTQHPEEVCLNLTRNECEAQMQEPVAPKWQLGEYCGINAQQCTRYQCPDRNYWCKWGYCPFPYSCIPDDPYCCSAICSSGPEGAYCCNTAWDARCCELAEYYCGQPISGDQCAPDVPVRGFEGALAIAVPGSKATSNLRATTDPGEPGFCCNAGTGTCIGGTNDGEKCVVATDCISGVCTERLPEPWAHGLGTVWFKFVMPAGMTTVGIHTCSSNSPALDSVVQVFTATDHSSAQAECNSLVPIGCNDDAAGCGSTGRNSRLCLRNLTPGNTYYIELAAKTENRRGQYIMTISTSCTGETQPCKNCPAGDLAFVDPPSGVVDARRPHPPNHPEVAEGIQAITALGPIWATKDCWSICESPTVPASIEISSVAESPPGTYSIHLNRPIAPGSEAIITYSNQANTQTAARFISHPANANGDGQSSPADILALVDHINGVKLLPWGLYSGDIDHSGAIGPADILTLIDLLNGANGFSTAWIGTPLPSGECP